MNRVFRAPFLWLGLLSMTGCSSSFDFSLGGSTKGERGRAVFSYETGFLSDGDDGDCLFGCPLAAAVVPGSEHDIRIDGVPDAASVDSSNPAVATVSFDKSCDCEQETADALVSAPLADGGCGAGFSMVCAESATFVAGEPGEAMLTVRDANGVMVDRTALRVAVPVRAEMTAFDPDEKPLASVRIAMNAEQSPFLHAVFFDASGLAVRTSHAVAWTVDDPATVQFSSWFVSKPSTQAGRVVSLTPLRPGRTTVRATVGDVTASLPIEVTE